MELIVWVLGHPYSLLIGMLVALTVVGVLDWYLPDEDLENPVDTEA